MPSLLQQTLFSLQFFTRLPIPGDHGKDKDLASAAIAFPIAGFVIGLLIAGIWTIAFWLLPPYPAAGLTVFFAVLVTGALHEDGFSDCADGLGGGFTKEKALEIMRDSRIGTYGAIALIFTIGLRWLSLGSVPLSAGIAMILIAHIVSRSAMNIALATSRYAREQGLGGSVAEGITFETLGITTLISLLLALVFGGFAGLLSGIIGLLIAWLFLQYLIKRIGGYTGDGLGAMQQVCEISIFIALAGYWAV